jgi:hypothetical protein
MIGIVVSFNGGSVALPIRTCRAADHHEVQLVVRRARAVRQRQPAVRHADVGRALDPPRRRRRVPLTTRTDSAFVRNTLSTWLGSPDTARTRYAPDGRASSHVAFGLAASAGGSACRSAGPGVGGFAVPGLALLSAFQPKAGPAADANTCPTSAT